MTTPNVEEFPIFLRSYEDLNDHLHSELDTLTNSEKGEIFAKFISRIIPISDYGNDLGEIELGKKSHDGGVDLKAQNTDATKVLYIQSKLTLRGVDDLDIIISKFKNYYETTHPKKAKQKSLFDQEENSDLQDVVFMIVTLSKIRNKILPQYEKSSRTSKEYYNQLTANNRLVIIDGPGTLPLLQAAYRKLHIVPSNVKLHMETPVVQKDNVYIGVLSASRLKACYAQFGDALFLENIRTFLGYSSGNKKDRENVNDAIRDTAEHSPDEMLARNNGITFRAKKVSLVDEKTLLLDHASIVNGCQTTMCIVQSSGHDAFVLVKIVEITDSWDVAKAANFQNRVEQVALDLARYVRPQAVKLAASRAGVHVDDKNDSVFDVFDAIYQEHVRYDEIYYLFLGIFSRTPRNVISKNYTDLRGDLLEGFKSKDPPLGEATFDTLFKLYKAAKEGQESAERMYTNESYKTIFQRFWRDNKPDYRSVITILAACGSVKVNIYGPATDLQTITQFLDKLRVVIENDQAMFVRYYRYAFETIASYLLTINSNKEEKEILRTMYDDIRGANFDTLYKQISIIADGRENAAQ